MGGSALKVSAMIFRTLSFVPVVGVSRSIGTLFASHYEIEEIIRSMGTVVRYWLRFRVFVLATI